MEHFRGTREHILNVLLHSRSPDGLPLGNIARKVGIAHPTALAHLRRLMDEGWVHVAKKTIIDPESGSKADTPRYAAGTTTGVQWVDSRFGMLEHWITTRPIDWRFPLVSRLPDGDAQSFFYEFLDRAQSKGLLPDYRSHYIPDSNGPPVVSLVVYGSCARGDSTPKSDIDFLLYMEKDWKGKARLIDFAYEVALGHTRPIDAHAVIGMEDVPSAFTSRIRHEGATIWCNDYKALPFEAPARSQNGI